MVLFKIGYGHVLYEIGFIIHRFKLLILRTPHANISIRNLNSRYGFIDVYKKKKFLEVVNFVF